MSGLEPTPDMYAVLDAARRMDLWQEDDQRTTYEYRRETFGLSDPVRDATTEARGAADAGLLALHVNEKTGARRWVLTASGREWLARAEQESRR